MGDLAVQGSGYYCSVCRNEQRGSNSRTGKAKFRVFEVKVCCSYFILTKSMLFCAGVMETPPLTSGLQLEDPVRGWVRLRASANFFSSRSSPLHDGALWLLSVHLGF